MLHPLSPFLFLTRTNYTQRHHFILLYFASCQGHRAIDYRRHGYRGTWVLGHVAHQSPAPAWAYKSASLPLWSAASFVSHAPALNSLSDERRPPLWQLYIYCCRPSRSAVPDATEPVSLRVCNIWRIPVASFCTLHAARCTHTDYTLSAPCLHPLGTLWHPSAPSTASTPPSRLDTLTRRQIIDCSLNHVLFTQPPPRASLICLWSSRLPFQRLTLRLLASPSVTSQSPLPC